MNKKPMSLAELTAGIQRNHAVYREHFERYRSNIIKQAERRFAAAATAATAIAGINIYLLATSSNKAALAFASSASLIASGAALLADHRRQLIRARSETDWKTELGSFSRKQRNQSPLVALASRLEDGISRRKMAKLRDFDQSRLVGAFPFSLEARNFKPDKPMAVPLNKPRAPKPS